MPHSQVIMIAVLGLSSVVHSAFTKFSEAQMQIYLASNSAGLAQLNAPVFFLGQNRYQPPCVPTWAYDGSSTTPDVYDAKERTAPAPRCNYPDVGCSCRDPGSNPGSPSPAFPIYYTVHKCTATEVRVVLNLFYEKDGAYVWKRPFRVDTGHDYDWERLVIWYDKDPSSGMWSAEKLSMSQHGGYQTKQWNDIETTLSYAQASAANPKNRWFLSGQDHPKIFIAWDKHPHFDNKYTADLGWIAQSVNTAFRSDDWWHFVEPRYFIKADISTSAGQAMEKDKDNWGEADSFPPKVDAGVCTDPHLRGSLSLNNSSLTLNLVNTTGLQMLDIVADA